MLHSLVTKWDRRSTVQQTVLLEFRVPLHHGFLLWNISRFFLWLLGTATGSVTALLSLRLTVYGLLCCDFNSHLTQNYCYINQLSVTDHTYWLQEAQLGANGGCSSLVKLSFFLGKLHCVEGSLQYFRYSSNFQFTKWKFLISWGIYAKFNSEMAALASMIDFVVAKAFK